MYTFSSKLKTFSLVLMLLGLVGIGIGFMSAPKTIEEVETILSESHAHGHHDHAVAHADHADAKHSDAEHKEHLEHVLHQLQNKPWAAFYVACIFFLLLSVGVMAFYAIQYAAQAGWSPILFRVMEGITAYMLPGSIIFFIVLVLSAMHMNHLFVWMDADVVANDTLIQGKSGYLNVTFFLIRAAIFLGLWNFFRAKMRKNSIAQDSTTDLTFYKKNFKLAATFLVIFIITESIMSWDWIMSVDPHWYSTLFGWYVFASFFVSGITAIALITLYLKSKGYLEKVNTSHIHDLAKFMFGISIFWTYLWFSQYMLIWYANIPEETVYFKHRVQGPYKAIFFLNLIINFLAPLLILMKRSAKRNYTLVALMAVVIIFGHWIDFYQMVMGSLMKEHVELGLLDFGILAFFVGVMIFFVAKALASKPLIAKYHPFLKESIIHHT